MSGSGGGGYGGGFYGEGVACEKIVIHTQLSSPVATVVAQLNVADVLDVVGQQGKISMLIVAKFHGQVAGGLADPQISRVLECLRDGYGYKATVTAIAGGQVKVRVEVR